MAKGLLFALVRRGSKLSYLEDGGKSPSQSKQKVHYQKTKSRFKVNRIPRSIEDKSSEGHDTPENTISVERTFTRKRLFNVALQKISKGHKITRNSPASSNNSASTENVLTAREMKSDCRSKPMIVPSVASGYFVAECNSSRKESTSKKKESVGQVMPRIMLTDHDAGNVSSTASKTLENRPRVQYSWNFGSLPQLRVDEKRKRPSSWTGESSPRLDDFTDRISRKTSASESEQSLRLWVGAMSISPSPSTQRRNLGSANSLRPGSRHSNRPDSSFDRSGRPVTLDSLLPLKPKDRCVRRATSWGRVDEVTCIDSGVQQNRKIDIFLPTV